MEPSQEDFEAYNLQHELGCDDEEMNILSDLGDTTVDHFRAVTLKVWWVRSIEMYHSRLYYADGVRGPISSYSSKEALVKYYVKQGVLDAEYIDSVVADHVQSVLVVDYRPPPLCDMDVLNTYTGLAAEKLPPPKAGTSTARIHYHLLHVICNGNNECHDYNLKWMAHRVQKPGEIPRVALVLRTLEGTGKVSGIMQFEW